MTNVKRIVFATDFSENSRKAEVMARDLRDNLGAELHVVHVFDPTTFEMPAPYFFMPGAHTWLQERLGDLKQRGEKHLSEYATELGSCIPSLLEGKPGPVLVKYAEESAADLIIMGTHGHTGVTRLVMGSVAQYVMRHTNIGVLTVRLN